MESRAVEHQLAEVRARWALIGGFRYGISRIYHSKLCTTASKCNKAETDVLLAAALSAYLSELSPYQSWTYPEEASSYVLNVSYSAAVDDRPTRNASSGYLMMKGSYPTTQSALELISGATNRMGPLEMRICVGLALTTSTCGPIGSSNVGAPTSFYSISRLTRLRPGS
jgi:hypothetical protein